MLNYKRVYIYLSLSSIYICVAKSREDFPLAIQGLPRFGTCMEAAAGAKFMGTPKMMGTE